MIQRYLWKIMHFVYVKLVKPILFLTSPDSAHTRAIGIASMLGKLTFFRLFTRIVFKPRVSKLTKQEIHGIVFDNPVGLAAGFDKNAEAVAIMSHLGFGFGEIGSITAEPCVGNEKPWFYRLPNTKSLVVNAGLANQGSKTVLGRLERDKYGVYKKYPVIVSVAKANTPSVVSVKEGIEDYIASMKLAAKNSRVDILEINISCPNTFGGEPFTKKDSLEQLLGSVAKLKLTKPIFIKMPSDLSWPKTKELLDIIVKHNIAGVTIANLMKDYSLVDTRDKLPSGISGSLSGMPAQNRSNELISKTYKVYGDKLTIIGLGGIFSADDAYKKIRLGASLVEFITGMIFCGPQLASEINDGIKMRLKQDGFEHISQAVGIDSVAKKLT